MITYIKEKGVGNKGQMIPGGAVLRLIRFVKRAIFYNFNFLKLKMMETNIFSFDSFCYLHWFFHDLATIRSGNFGAFLIIQLRFVPLFSFFYIFSFILLLFVFESW
jgi:hypothetical protein